MLLCLVAAWGLIGTNFEKNIDGEKGNMKLLNQKTGFVLLEFIDQKPFFFDRLLEEALTHEGIFIPVALRRNFQGKEIIRTDEKEFYRAFMEIYYPMNMNPSIFVWESSDQEEKG